MRESVRPVTRAVGVLLLVGVAVALLALFAGGITYRKECNEGGEIKSHWTVTAPIPYALRPGDSRCVVHTATRVALSHVGIDKFEPTTPDVIAKRSAPRSTAYYLALRSVLVDFLRRSQRARSLSRGQAIVRTTRSRLSRLTP